MYRCDSHLFVGHRGYHKPGERGLEEDSQRNYACYQGGKLALRSVAEPKPQTVA
jgi:hypothetical protein